MVTCIHKGNDQMLAAFVRSHPSALFLKPHCTFSCCLSYIESKRARKRRKRREQANKAAETELAEISLEQRLLKEGLKKSVGAAPGIISDASIVKEAKKQGGGSGKKSKEPITFSIADVLDAMQVDKSQ